MYCVKCHKKFIPKEFTIVKFKGRSGITMKAKKAIHPVCGTKCFEIVGKA